MLLQVHLLVHRFRGGISAFDLFILQWELPTIILLFQSFSVISSIVSLHFRHSCLRVLFPLTTVCTNGWLSIFLTASDPRHISPAGMTKTLSWPLTRKETARHFHPTHDIALIAFISHVIIVQVPRHSILRAANARPSFPLAALISSAYFQLLV